MDKTERIIMAVTCAIIVLIAMSWEQWSTNNEWEAEAIKHNAGYYDSKTAEFKWNDEKKGD